jgi:hypothetical protein
MGGTWQVAHFALSPKIFSPFLAAAASNVPAAGLPGAA